MGTSTITATVVGVSYITLVENGEDERIDDAASECGLDTWSQMPKFDKLTDMYVGVVFYNRPTDEQVADATAKVRAALPKLTELLGKPDSAVECWSGVCVS